MPQGLALALPDRAGHAVSVKTKKAGPSTAEPKSSGTKAVEKHRPRMSRLTKAEREKLMERGLQMLYAPTADSTHRG